MLCGLYRGGATPQLAWALVMAQAQPSLELLAFPADLPADVCVNSAGNTFPGEVIP